MMSAGTQQRTRARASQTWEGSMEDTGDGGQMFLGTRETRQGQGFGLTGSAVGSGTRAEVLAGELSVLHNQRDKWHDRRKHKEICRPWTRVNPLPTLFEPHNYVIGCLTQNGRLHWSPSHGRRSLLYPPGHPLCLLSLCDRNDSNSTHTFPLTCQVLGFDRCWAGLSPPSVSLFY